MYKETESISSILKHLKEDTRYKEFNVNNSGIILIDGKQYTPQEIKSIKTFKVEEGLDAEEKVLIYQIITFDGVVAYSLDVYGMYSNSLADKYKDVMNSLSGNASEREMARLICNQLQLEKKNRCLKMLNEDLNTFVHTASHDLLAPLANIEMSIRLITELQVTDAELQDYIRIMKVSIQKFRELVLDISAIGVIEGDMLALQSVNVDEMIANVEWSLNAAIEKEHAVISKNIEVKYLMFSRKNLRSILYNLVSNAIKFHNGTAPLITIEVKKCEHGVTLTVEDNGIGIPESDQTRIFNLYGRLHEKVQGKGIGLYLAKKIIDSIEGTITVESEVDKGTKFTLFFPSHTDAD